MQLEIVAIISGIAAGLGVWMITRLINGPSGAFLGGILLASSCVASLVTKHRAQSAIPKGGD
jgi:multisubunit Na+/H+ antiporter MnhB subunit